MEAAGNSMDEGIFDFVVAVDGIDYFGNAVADADDLIERVAFHMIFVMDSPIVGEISLNYSFVLLSVLSIFKLYLIKTFNNRISCYETTRIIKV